MALACLAFIAVFALVLSRGPPASHSNVRPSLASSVQTTLAPDISPETVRSGSGANDTGGRFDCADPTVTDGDTLRCGSLRVRLASIDAPELPGHCRPGRTCTPGDPFASTDNLRRLIGGRSLECQRIETDHYGRTVAFCYVAGINLSCAQVQAGVAVVRYGSLSCS